MCHHEKKWRDTGDYHKVSTNPVRISTAFYIIRKPRGLRHTGSSSHLGKSQHSLIRSKVGLNLMIEHTNIYLNIWKWGRVTDLVKLLYSTYSDFSVFRHPSEVHFSFLSIILVSLIICYKNTTISECFIMTDSWRRKLWWLKDGPKSWL